MVDFFVKSLIVTIIMMCYELLAGSLYKFVLKKHVPWVYVKYKNHKYRSITPFSPHHFFAWYLLGMIIVFILGLL